MAILRTNEREVLTNIIFQCALATWDNSGKDLQVTPTNVVVNNTITCPNTLFPDGSTNKVIISFISGQGSSTDPQIFFRSTLNKQVSNYNAAIINAFTQGRGSSVATNLEIVSIVITTLTGKTTTHLDEILNAGISTDGNQLIINSDVRDNDCQYLRAIQQWLFTRNFVDTIDKDLAANPRFVALINPVVVRNVNSSINRVPWWVWIILLFVLILIAIALAVIIDSYRRNRRQVKVVVKK